MDVKSSKRGSDNKKRHHFVPITYLQGFTDERGRVQTYLCDIGGDPKPLAPATIAFQNYYYAQPSADGRRDTTQIEGLFDTNVEQPWPAAKEAARTGAWTPKVWADLYLMMASLRARVPAARELIESSLAASVRMTSEMLEASGRIDPLPSVLTKGWDDIQIAIDPFKSLEAMPQLLEATSRVQQMIGFEILHNETSRPFITSDNPVAWFDRSVSEARRRPYAITPQGRAELQFPIDAWTMLRGSWSLRDRQGGGPPLQRRVRDEDIVRRHNRVTAQYAYRLAFGVDRSSDRLVGLFADRSPVLSTQTVPAPGGRLLWLETVFGRRPSLPKWRSSDVGG